MNIGVEKSLDLLSDIVLISNSTLHLEERLKAILEQIQITFSFQGIAIYALNHDRGEFLLKAEEGRSFSSIAHMSEEPLQICIREKERIFFDKNSRDYNFLFKNSVEKPSGSGGLFPIVDDKFFYGIIAISLNGDDKFQNEDLAILKPVSHEIAGTMRNAQLYTNAKETVENLLVLNETWKEMNSTLHLDELLEITINRVCGYLRSKKCIIKISSQGIELEKTNIADLSDGKWRNISNYLFEKTGETKETIIPNSDKLSELQSPSQSVMAVPLNHHNRFIGTICLFDKFDGSLFNIKDRNISYTLASQISAVIDHALLLDKSKEISKDKEMMVKELTMLFELNKAVMTTIDLDRLLHIILTAVTIGDGFGFNRAMLFLYNEATGTIQGMMGVGPDSWEEAGKVWYDINQEHKTLHDFVEKSQLELPQSKLNETVKSQRVSIEETSILGLTVKEKRSFNIKNVSEDQRVNKELMCQLNCNAFATVPLLASGKSVGIIMVDNIYNGRAINDEDVRLLTLFANQAGMAIDNSMLYKDLQRTHHELKRAHSKLVHTEKLAALGEMAAGVAHEIRNPLVSIGGFARRLSRKLEGNDNVNYVNIICKEVERLESILNDILVFSREGPLELGCHDVNLIINDSLEIFIGEFKNCNICLEKNLANDLEKVEANFHQLKQVFINLFSNAKHAMQNGGKLYISSYKTEVDGGSLSTIEISDTGSGIPYNIMSNIFNPFFTTKTTGTGLGLAITHKILSTYGGEIEVYNNDSGGATFKINLPGS